MGFSGSAIRLKGSDKLIYVYDNEKSGKASLSVDVSGHISTITKVYTENQTNTALITPSSGKKISIRDVYVGVNADSGNVECDFATSNIPVLRVYAAKFKSMEMINTHLEGAVDEPLSITTTTGDNDIFISVNYLEIE